MHNQHVTFIRKAVSAIGLDKVLLVPTYMPPHKKSTATPYAIRRDMLREFAKTEPNVVLEEAELECGSSYAYEVVDYLKNKYAGDELYYLMGSDSLIRLGAWRSPEKLVGAVKIRVAGRGEHDGIPELCAKYSELYGGNVEYMFDCERESSGKIRLDVILKNYPSVESAVPQCVYRAIRENDLYSGYRVAADKLKTMQSDKLFAHSVSVAEYAVEHAWMVWESFDNAYYAGLLHDSAKGREDTVIYDCPDGTAPEVKHQYAGAVVAKEAFGIHNEAVLDAIRYHTTAKPQMSELGKLIYVADKLEYRRAYEGVDELRRIADVDFEEGFRRTLKHGYDFIISKDATPDVLTSDACAWYNIPTKS